MEKKCIDAAFRVNGINLAITEGNGAAACKLGINESMVRRWRWQIEELFKCKS